MTSFYPSEKETRLVSLTPEQLYLTLEKRVKPLKRGSPDELPKGFLFNGSWNKDAYLSGRQAFSISLKLKVPNNFIPIINGNFITSEEGILIRLTYELFPATKRLLMIWTILTLLITAFFIGLYQAWLYGAISFAFCIVNYILSRENFKIQVKKSKRMVDKLFLNNP